MNFKLSLRSRLNLVLVLALIPIQISLFTLAVPVPVSAQDGEPTLVLSHTRGYYTAPFDLTLTVPDGYEVFYTLNGDEPTRESIPYEGPVSISSRAGEPNSYSMISGTTYEYATWAPPVDEVFKATVFRAALFDSVERVGPVWSHTYFVDEGMPGRYGLMVISIVTDSLNFFGYEEGIYMTGKIFDEWRQANPSLNLTFNGGAPTNYGQRGEEWERPIHIEFFEPDGRVAMAQDAGVRIHGGWSRAFRQKSLRLYSRSDYGTSRFSYRIFPENPLSDFNRLILRNSGQDWTQTMLRDAFMQSLAKNLGFDTMESRPAAVFINGEFWGIHNIRERYDVHYIETNYGVDREQIDILTGFRQEKEGSRQHYLDMINYIEANGLTSNVHFNYLRTLMDVENYRDYYISNIYINNTDWPHNNIDYWRKQTAQYEPDAPYGHDGRWRWMMFDTDFGFGWNRPVDAYRFNNLERVTSPDGSTGNNPWSTFLIRRMLDNPGFRNDFIDRFADLLNTNFRPDRVLGQLEAMKSEMEPWMQEHFDRWGYFDDRWKTPQNLNDWEGRLDLMRHFAQTRAAWVRTHLAGKFDLGGSRDLTVDVASPGGGTVKVNSIYIRAETPGVDAGPYPWTGIYFNFRPVRLVAIPEPGYRFAGWTGRSSSTAETISITMSGHTEITAWFEPDDSAETGGINPVPHRLVSGDYAFRRWSASQPDSTFPPNMVFLQSQMDDPLLEDDVSVLYHIPHDDYHEDDLATVGYPYNNTRRTRMVGLEDGGVAFINTGRGRDLGAAVLALDTRGVAGLDVTWTGGTLEANSRTYNIRLQYRVGSGGIWEDVTGPDGQPKEYRRSSVAGHSSTIGPVRLPETVENKAYVQLRWKYYYTGTRLSEASGQRDMLRLDNITVTAAIGSTIEDDVAKDLPGTYNLGPNYPNPFNPGTLIRYSLPEAGSVRLVVYDILGQEVSVLAEGFTAAGRHTAWFDGSGLASGIYLYRLEAGGRSLTGKMMLVK